MARDAVVVRRCRSLVFLRGMAAFADLRIAGVRGCARVLVRVVASDAREFWGLLKAAAGLESNGCEADREWVFHFGDFRTVLDIRRAVAFAAHRDHGFAGCEFSTENLEFRLFGFDRFDVFRACAMAAFARDAWDHCAEVGAWFDIGRMAVEAAVDVLRRLNDADCRFGIDRCRCRMSWCECEPLWLRIKRQTVLEVATVGDAANAVVAWDPAPKVHSRRAV